jgi:hypothetical protein
VTRWFDDLLAVVDQVNAGPTESHLADAIVDEMADPETAADDVCAVVVRLP